MTINEAIEVAKSHHRAGRLPEAEGIYRQILAAQPNDAQALMLLGVMAGQIGKTDDAIRLLQRALAINPSLADGHNNLGNAYRQKNMLEEAIAAYRSAIALKPDSVNAYYNLGVTLCDRGRFDEAAAALREAIRIQPDFAGAYNGLGNSLGGLGNSDEANAAFARSIALTPNQPDFHWNYAINLLLAGNYEQGWEELEWRFRVPRMKTDRTDVAPMWDGTDLKGKTILVWTEGGFGDVIFFVRYVPMVAARGGKIVLECQRGLFDLLRQIPGVDQFIERASKPPALDCQIPLASLPRVFGTTLANVPANVPYLNASPEKVQHWKQRISALGPARNIGIAWAGHDVAEMGRSMPPENLGALMRMPGIRWISLQKSVGEARPLPPEMTIVDWTSELQDFTDTAGLIANLDLVISVDTAVAHLAGAMGRPVWTLLASACDFRWMRNRQDTPWYPTMRLFRQKNAGDWAEVVDRVSRSLAHSDAESG